MSFDSDIILLTSAFVLVVILLVLAIRRMMSEGITLDTPKKEHFKRSADEIRQQLEQERLAAESASTNTETSEAPPPESESKD